MLFQAPTSEIENLQRCNSSKSLTIMFGSDVNLLRRVTGSPALRRHLAHRPQLPSGEPDPLA